MAEELEEKKIAADAVKAKLLALQEGQAAVTQAAADAAKQKARAVAAAAKKVAEEAEAKRTKAAISKSIQEAVEEFQRQ
jgi:hypothetical protein